MAGKSKGRGKSKAGGHRGRSGKSKSKSKSNVTTNNKSGGSKSKSKPRGRRRSTKESVRRKSVSPMDQRKPRRGGGSKKPSLNSRGHRSGSHDNGRSSWGQGGSLDDSDGGEGGDDGRNDSVPGNEGQPPSTPTEVTPGGGTPGPPAPEGILQPLKSPRDLNKYRVIRLPNQIEVLLVSTCGYGLCEVKPEEPPPPPKTDEDGKCPQKKDYSPYSRKRTEKLCPEQGAKGGGNESGSSGGQDHGEVKPNDCGRAQVEDFMRRVSDLYSGPRGSIIEQITQPWTEEPTPSPVSDPEESLSPEERKRREDIACKFVQANATGATARVQCALTFGFGSMFDPENLKGLSGLALSVLKDLVARTQAKQTFVELSTDGATMSTIKICSSLATIGKDIKEFARVISTAKNIDDKTRKKLFKDLDLNQKIIDSLDQSFCFGWLDTRTDPRLKAILTSTAAPSHHVRSISTFGSPRDLRYALEGTIGFRPHKRGEGQEEGGDEPTGQLTDLTGTIVAFLSSNIGTCEMSLALKGPKLLDELEEMAKGAFGVIQDGDANGFVDTETPFDTPAFKQFYMVKSTNPMCCNKGQYMLLLTWALPSAFWKNHKTKPLDFLGYMISHSGIGGLEHNLIERNLAYAVEAGNIHESGFHRNPFTSIFQIEVRLTLQGRTQFREVIQTIYSYLYFLSSNKHFRDEAYRDLQRIRFSFFNLIGHEVTLQDPYPLEAPEASRALMTFPTTDDLLLGPSTLLKFDSDEISKALDCLGAGQANYMFCGCFKDVNFQETEPIFGTNYCGMAVPDETMNSWKSPPSLSFSFPEKNQFINEDYCQNQRDPEDGIILYMEPGTEEKFRIWYEQRNASCQHFSIYYVHLISPLAFESPENSVMLDIWFLILKDLLRAKLAGAVLAGIDYSLTPTHAGLLVTVHSWNSKMYNVLEVIFGEIAGFLNNFSNEGIFQIKREEWMRHICGMLTEDHYSSHYLAEDMMDSIEVMDHHPLVDQYESLKKHICWPLFRDFVQGFLNQSTFVAHFYGNVVKQNAANFSGFMQAKFPSLGSVSLSEFTVRMYLFPHGTHTMRIETYSKETAINLVLNAYQIGFMRPCEIAMAELVMLSLNSFIMREMLNDWDSETLDPATIYFQAYLRRKQGVFSLMMVAEGSAKEHDVRDLDEEIEGLLDSFWLYLSKMSSGEFERLRTDLGKKYEYGNGAKGLYQELSYLYETIHDLSLHLSERYCKVVALKCIKREDVQKWFKANFLNPDGLYYRKISFQVYTKNKTDDPYNGTLLPPKVWRQRRALRKNAHECSFDTPPHRPLQCEHPEVENFELKLDPDDEGNCENTDFITDVETFRNELFEFPDFGVSD